MFVINPTSGDPLIDFYLMTIDKIDLCIRNALAIRHFNFQPYWILFLNLTSSDDSALGILRFGDVG